MKKKTQKPMVTALPTQTPNDNTYITSDHSPIIPQRSKLKTLLKIYERPDLTENQKKFLELANKKDARIIFVNGCAGTSKTFLSVFYALKMLNEKRVSDLIYVRSVVECAERSIGFLPGSLDEKILVYIKPLMDKLEELLSKADIDLLLKEKRIQGLPINFLRGLHWNAKVIILDEAQNCNYKELLTFITRIGMFSKTFIIGDSDQSDINSHSGFLKMINVFDDEESQEHGIYVFRFTENDIVRSDIVKFIINKLNKSL